VRTFLIAAVETEGWWAVKPTSPITTVETDGLMGGEAYVSHHNRRNVQRTHH
jgi:hypothetical protein